jgi:hypothetical protein
MCYKLHQLKGGDKMLRFQTLPKTKIMVLVLVLGYMFILSPPNVAAQGIAVDPPSWDFGDVVLGTLETQTFRISPTEILPLTVQSISFTVGSSSAFSFEEFLLDGTTPITGVPPSYTLSIMPSAPPNFIDVTVGFTPSTLGTHTASIEMWSDAAPPDGTLFVPLSGSGVPVPSSMLLVCIGLAGLAGIKRKFRGQ